MSLDIKKLRLTFFTMIICAWIIGAGHLGFAYFNDKPADQEDKIELSTGSTSTVKTIENKSVLLTGIIGAFHYFYKN